MQKGKRTKREGLGKVLDETKTNEVVPKVGIEPVPERCPQVHRLVAPRTATEHAQGAVPIVGLHPRQSICWRL